MAVDLDAFPYGRVMFDTNVLIRALRAAPGDEHCAELFEGLIRTKRTILIGTPSLAEFMRKSADSVPRTPSVVVVPFDRESARILGQVFPKSVLIEARDAGGGPLDYFKFDAMILAIAARQSVPLITEDFKPGMVNLARAGSVTLHRPAEFQGAQTTMIFTTTPGPQSPTI